MHMTVFDDPEESLSAFAGPFTFFGAILCFAILPRGLPVVEFVPRVTSLEELRLASIFPWCLGS